MGKKGQGKENVSAGIAGLAKLNQKEKNKGKPGKPQGPSGPSKEGDEERLLPKEIINHDILIDGVKEKLVKTFKKILKLYMKIGERVYMKLKYFY